MSRVRSSNELIRWSFFWFFVLIGLNVFDEGKRGNVKFRYWLVVDCTLGIVSTFTMMAASRFTQGWTTRRLIQTTWWLVLFPLVCHFLWWLFGPTWRTADGTTAFMYFIKHPLESNIPFLWLVDGCFVIGQPACQVIVRLSREPKALDMVQKSEELLRWSFFWLFVLFGLVIFDVELHGNTVYAVWVGLEWPIMFASTLIMRQAVRRIDDDTDSLWSKAACATVAIHFLWWTAAGVWPTKSGPRAWEYALTNPFASNIPFIWSVDGLFVLCQPFLQFRLMQAHRTVQARMLNEELLRR